MTTAGRPADQGSESRRSPRPMVSTRAGNRVHDRAYHRPADVAPGRFRPVLGTGQIVARMAMKFIIPVPTRPYYLWQALVQMAHFREMGYEEDAHYPIVYFNDRPSDLLLRFWESDDLRASLHLYPDKREDRSYSASMAPWLLGQFFEQFPDQVASVYNYLDPDCVLTGPMDFSPFLGDDDVWYGSDTRLYAGAELHPSEGRAAVPRPVRHRRRQRISGARARRRHDRCAVPDQERGPRILVFGRTHVGGGLPAHERVGRPFPPAGARVPDPGLVRVDVHPAVPDHQARLHPDRG